MSLALVYFESNIVDVPSDTWWFDSGATTHVAITLQGFINKQKPSLKEAKLRVACNLEVDVKFVGEVKLSLKIGFEITLCNTFYVPSFRSNLRGP